MADDETEAPFRADDSGQAPAVTPAPQISPATVDTDPGYTPDGVPTFESVREKIETRYGTSAGAVELGAETPEGRRAEEQYQARQQAAAERLEQIRASMESERAEATGDRDDG
jgi:phage shock protein A